MALHLGAPAPCPRDPEGPIAVSAGWFIDVETVVPACPCAWTKVSVCHSPQGALSLSPGQQAEVAGASLLVVMVLTPPLAQQWAQADT